MRTIRVEADSSVGSAEVNSHFGGFLQVSGSDRRKTPTFFEAAMSAKSANCGSCVLLADLGNASTFRLVADDLRQGL